MPDTGPFVDRRETLFGRSHALEVMRRRADHPGLTALVGRPQSGKSWLLQELARTLTEDQGLLVGYQESKGGAPDNLLHAVQDLYTRWLSDSTYREQAKAAYKQHSKGLLAAGVRVLAEVFSEMPGIANPIGKLVESGLNGMLRAREDLSTGRLILPPLQYDQAQDLLRLIYKISGKRLILILDAWEQTTASALEDEHGLLHALIRDRSAWPPCQVFVALRPESPALQHIETMHREFGEGASIFPLEPMDLSNPSEEKRLVRYLREHLPASKSIGDAELIEMIGGYAGVVGRWVNRATLPENAQALRRLAEDAHANRYPELPPLIDDLSDETRGLAIRLALLDNAGIESWPQLRDVLLLNRPAIDLDLLARCGLLESTNPPTYGHAKRAEVARTVFSNHYINGLNEELGKLVETCADRVLNTDIDTLPFSKAMLTIGELIRDLQPLQPETKVQRLLTAIRVLFGEPIEPIALMGAAESSHGITLLAMGVFNTLNQAKDEGDLAQRDALLEELRALAAAHDEATVQKLLAMGLSNTLNHAQDEGDLVRRDTLLEELRALATAHDEATVRESLALGLSNTLNHAKDEDNLARRDALLEELRALAAAHDDAAVQERLAQGLLNTLNHAKDKDNRARRDTLLGELRTLAAVHDDAVVRERLAQGLLDTLNHAKDEDDLAWRDTLLDELRALAAAHDETSVRERLAIGLFNTLSDAKDEENLVRRDALLEELRALASAHDEATVRGYLAMGLSNTLIDAKHEDDLARRDALLEELRALAVAYDEAAVLERLAKGLFNTMLHTKDEDDRTRQIALLGELVALSAAHEDAAVSKILAHAQNLIR